MKKKLIIGSALATLAIGIIVPITTMSASALTSTSGTDSLIDKLVSKFGLNKSDVQKVFDEDRTTKDTEREQAQTDKLVAAVKAGKITQAQSDKITAKLAEIKADRETNHTAMESKTEAERKTAMEAKKTELDAWAKDNGIDISYLMMGDGPGHIGGQNNQ